MSVEPVWKHVRVEASSDEEFTRGIVRGKHELLFDESTELPGRSLDGASSPPGEDAPKSMLGERL